MTFKSKPPDKIPSLPVIIKQPFSVGTSSKHSLISLDIFDEKTFAFPSSRVMIDIFSSFLSVASFSDIIIKIVLRILS